MLRQHKDAIRDGLLRYITALLLGAGMALCVLGALLPAQAPAPTVLWCALFALGFEGLFSLKFRFKWLLPVGALAALLIWGALGGGPGYTFIQLCKAGILALRGIPDAAAPYADAARIAVCLMFSLLAAALSWDDTLPLSVFCVLTTVALCLILGGNEQLLLYALPAFGGLVMLLGRNEKFRGAVLPVAAVAVGAAFLLLPARTSTVPALENTARQVQEFLEDYLFFNEFRTSFSLSSQGFQPLTDRLGGKATPNNAPVMEVATGRTVLLRGKTYNDYSGLNWYDTLSSRRYLYASPRFSSLREQLFGLNKPLAGAENGGEETLRVHMLADGPTTLFAPVATRSLQMESQRMVLYYNSAAELFITRDVAAGDSYTLSYLPFTPGEARTARTVAACAEMEDGDYAEIADTYLALPRHIQQEIYDIANAATQGADTPYEKALAIQQYLQTHYRYTLDAQTPPDGVDFVAWFLLGAKEGYCTYFATAMTVLCRIAGVPARYATGYLAIPDESGLAQVTGAQAHAWTEVYLNGFGWLDFDATPRGDNQRSDPPQSDDTDSSPSAAPSESPLPTPTPEPPEAATPSPQPSDAPSENPSPSPDASETPAPPPPGQTPPPPENPPDQPPAAWPWMLLALALLTALLVWRYLWTEPVRRANRHPAQAADIFFAAMCALLRCRGLTKAPAETLHAFAIRADEALGDGKLPPLLPLADAYAGQVYGRHPAAPADFRAAYLRFRAAAPWYIRLRLALKRCAPRKPGFLSRKG